ncbi:FkbM family methyltransferase [Mesorhizobium sp. B3-1-9]|uniref:FkbM family methyltransferase n=1 Tax=Mesorhizobium sp. B3-1-9 TaxID=2589892 RepID=UPI001FEDE3FB|nr:FkbM family methyltransferase [Mesorhizobium sp. B3-1-9]
MITSYAQNFEDVILWRALKSVEHGFYIDIGAQDPIVDSVSLAFYEHGWRGVHVEPISSNAAKLRVARSDEEVLEAAIARHEGTATFHEIPETGLSTGNDEIAAMHANMGFVSKSIEVTTLPLSILLDRYSDREIHWLKIDVEGMEAETIASWQPSPVRPWVLVIESTIPLSRDESYFDWEPAVLAMGYTFVYFDGLNRFYLHEAHSDLRPVFGAPPNIFDDFTLSGLSNSPFAHRLNGEITNLKTALDERNQGAAHASREIARLHRYIAESENGHSAERAAYAELAGAIEKLGQEKDAEIDRLHHHIAETEKSHAAERTTFAKQVAAIEEKDTEIGRLHHYIAETGKGHAATLAMLGQRTAELEAIARTSSWRMTAPLRSVKARAMRMSRAPKQGVTLFMDHGLLWVRRRPRILSLLRGVVRLAPPLERQLILYSHARLHPVDSARPFWSLEPDPTTLHEWRRLLGLPRQ